MDAVPALGPHLGTVVPCHLLLATLKGAAYLWSRAASVAQFGVLCSGGQGQ